MKAFHLEQRPTEMDHSKTLALTYLLPCVLERQLPEGGAPSFPLTPEPVSGARLQSRCAPQHPRSREHACVVTRA